MFQRRQTSLKLCGRHRHRDNGLPFLTIPSYFCIPSYFFVLCMGDKWLVWNLATYTLPFLELDSWDLVQIVQIGFRISILNATASSMWKSQVADAVMLFHGYLLCFTPWQQISNTFLPHLYVVISKNPLSKRYECFHLLKLIALEAVFNNLFFIWLFALVLQYNLASVPQLINQPHA